MNPEKVKNMYGEMSEELHLNPQLLETLGGFYWKRVREDLSGLPALKVHLDNLGSFAVKHWTLDKQIADTERLHESVQKRSDGGRKESLLSEISRKLNLLLNLKSIKTEEDQRKTFIYEHKKSTKSTDQAPEHFAGDLELQA